MMKQVFALACAVQLLVCPAADNPDVDIEELLLALSSEDVSDEGEFVPTTVENDYSAFLAEKHMTGNQLLNRVGDIVKAAASNVSTATNHFKRRIVSCGLNFLNDYGGTNAYSVYTFVITNAVPEVAVDLASFYSCTKDVEANCASSVYQAQDFWNMSMSQRAPAVLGLTMAFDAKRPSQAVTNRMLAVGMKALPRGESFGQFDSRVVDWWPDYATSSNRYLAAQRALQVVPPPASSNYLNRVIAELEALPPGTMHLLPTNHLGTAWSE